MQVEQATIKVVNVREFSVDVLTDETSRFLLGVPLMQPLSHPDHAGGIHMLPDVGAKCWICTPGAPTSAFVLGFMWDAPTQEGSRPYDGVGPNFTGNRPTMEPGDICIQTVDGNYVNVRRGGVVQIGASGLCQRIYIPVGNVVRDYFQRYHAVSPIGEISWSHARLIDNDGVQPDGSVDISQIDLPVTVRYNIKTSLKDDVSGPDKPFPVELRIGTLCTPGANDTAANNRFPADLATDKRHVFANDEIRNGLEDASGTVHPKSGDTSISLIFTSPDDPDRKVTYGFQVSRTGDTYEISAGHVLAECGGSYTIQARKDVVLRGGGETNSSDDNMVVRFEALRDWLKGLIIPTAMGPTQISPADLLKLDQNVGNIGSVNVKVSK